MVDVTGGRCTAVLKLCTAVERCMLGVCVCVTVPGWWSMPAAAGRAQTLTDAAVSCVAPSGGGAVAGAAAEEVRRRALRLRGCALCGRPRQGARARRPRPHGARTQIRGRRRADSTVRMLTLTMSGSPLTSGRQCGLEQLPPFTL